MLTRSELRDVRARIKAADINEIEIFSHSLREGLESTGMSEKDFAAALSVSPPTVNRWVRGKNAPHPAFRRVVIEQLDKFLKQAINRMDQQRHREKSADRGRQVAPGTSPLQPL